MVFRTDSNPKFCLRPGHGCGAAADVADVKPTSGFSLSDVTPMSFPSRMNLQYPRPVRLEDELMPVSQVENEIQKGGTKAATQPMQTQIDECVQHDEYDDLWQGRGFTYLCFLVCGCA